MTSTPATTPTPALDRFFATLRRSPVTRSQDRVIAGVCAGVAERLGVSTAFVRVAAVILALLGPAVAVYFLAWLLLPGPDGRIRLESAIREGDGSSIVLMIVTALAVIPDLFGHAHIAPVAVLAAGFVAFVAFKKGWFGSRANQGAPWAQHTNTTSTSTTPAASQPDGPQDAPRA